MNTVKLVTVFGENRLGWMARITKVLAEANVNIRWVTIATSGAVGVIKLLVDQSEIAMQQLKQNGFPVASIEVLGVAVGDKPGALHEVTDVLARHRINVENSSGFVTRAQKSAVLLLEVVNLPQACEVLGKHGLHLLNPEEVLTL